MAISGGRVPQTTFRPTIAELTLIETLLDAGLYENITSIVLDAAHRYAKAVEDGTVLRERAEGMTRALTEAPPADTAPSPRPPRDVNKVITFGPDEVTKRLVATLLAGGVHDTTTGVMREALARLGADFESGRLIRERTARMQDVYWRAVSERSRPAASALLVTGVVSVKHPAAAVYVAGRRGDIAAPVRRTTGP